MLLNLAVTNATRIAGSEYFDGRLLNQEKERKKREKKKVTSEPTFRQLFSSLVVASPSIATNDIISSDIIDTSQLSQALTPQPQVSQLLADAQQSQLGATEKATTSGIIPKLVCFFFFFILCKVVDNFQ